MTRALAVLAILVAPLIASAHTDGVSYEAQVDGHSIDIAYSTDSPVAGELVLFDFNLPAEEADTQYRSVWVRITRPDDTVIFATGITNAFFGGPRLSYAFPEPGTYTVFVRYEGERDSLFETSFAVTVAPETGAQGLMTDIDIPTLVAGLLIGAGIVYFLPRRPREAA